MKLRNPIIICILILSANCFLNNLKNFPLINLSSDKKIKGFGYWLFGKDMITVNLNELSKNGVSDIFLNYYAFTLYPENGVLKWVDNANKLNIRIHIWMQAFFRDGKWIDPTKSDNSKILSDIRTEAKKYALLKGVSGVHFDYLRYPGNAYNIDGGTTAINLFIKTLVSTIRSVNSKCIISAALMPETTASEKYYGQDYTAISKYMDVVIPMIYKGNYKGNTAWIKTTSEWYVQNTQGASVWVGLQSYKSDDDTTKLPLTELSEDVKAALNAKANGVVLFRYGLSNNINFKSL